MQMYEYIVNKVRVILFWPQWVNPSDVPYLSYKSHQIPKLKCFSSCIAVVFAQSIEAGIKLRMKM